MMLNGLLSIKGFQATNKFSSAEADKDKNFLEVFNSKVQSKNNSYPKTFSSIGNSRVTTEKKVSKNIYATANSSVEESKSAGEINEEQKQIESTEGIEDKGKQIKSTKSTEMEENAKVEFLTFKSQEKKLQQYEDIIPPLLLQQLEEMLVMLHQQGYLKQDEIQEITVKIEETSTMKETILMLYSQLQEHGIIINGEFKDFEAIKGFEEFLEFAKTIYGESVKQLTDRISGEVYEPDKVVSEKVPKGFVAEPVEEERPEVSKLQQDVLDAPNSNKSTKNVGVEKADNEGTYSVIDLSKSFDIRINNITNESLNSKEIFGKDLLEQLIHKVDEIYKTGKNQFKLQLVPENLGKLSINLSSENQMVKAKVYVESLQVKEAIESRLNEFKDTLREKGINITNVEVSVGQDPETFQQRRSFIQQKIRHKKPVLNVDEGVGTIQRLDTMVNLNPYLVATGFDKLG